MGDVVEEKGGAKKPPRGSRKKRSGGPRTARGKAVVRLNPVRHGVLSTTPVLPLVERQEDWERLRDGLFEYWQPEGMMEGTMVERIAFLFWRQYRAVRFESESIAVRLSQVPRDWRLNRMGAGLPVPESVTPELVEEMDRMLTSRLLPDAETVDLIMRYETKLHRFLMQTIHQLLLLQELRLAPRRGRGRRTTPPDQKPPQTTRLGEGRLRKQVTRQRRSRPAVPAGAAGTYEHER